MLWVRWYFFIVRLPYNRYRRYQPTQVSATRHGFSAADLIDLQVANGVADCK